MLELGGGSGAGATSSRVHGERRGRKSVEKKVRASLATHGKRGWKGGFGVLPT